MSWLDKKQQLGFIFSSDVIMKKWTFKDDD